MIRIIAYKCPYCHAIMEEGIELHQKICNKDPANRTCETCTFNDGYDYKGTKNNPILKVKCTCLRIPGLTNFQKNCYDYSRK